MAKSKGGREINPSSPELMLAPRQSLIQVDNRGSTPSKTKGEGS